MQVYSLVTRLFFFLPIAWIPSVHTVHAGVDLEWRPSASFVAVGETVEIGLFAVSNGATNESVGVIECIMVWNSSQLELLGHTDNGPYAWLESGFGDDSAFDGLNDPFGGLPTNDGDALYTARSQLGSDPAEATPGGLLVASFEFRALSNGIAPLNMPATFGTTSNTRVISGETAGLVITGSLSAPASIQVGEPVPLSSGWGMALMTLGVLTLGVLVVEKQRKRRMVENESI